MTSSRLLSASYRSAVPLTLAGLVIGSLGCSSGSKWMAEPLVAEEERSPPPPSPGGGRRPGIQRARTIGARAEEDPDRDGVDRRTASGGRVLGTFRNTYYDFPNENDHRGKSSSAAPLMNASCKPIATVPRTFHDAVCVQGSGSLANGTTVSFAKRDCACAEICPRTGQRICFEPLDRATFPWGRGAAGRPITPLRSVAADTSVLPMGTVLYIPELDGIEGDGGKSDGCFVVEDRGLRVQGDHVDIFTGDPTQTAAVNGQVPTNAGVTVVLDVPKCAHLAKR